MLAGQVIGYVGDSTNAEETRPHLHFELHDPDGNPVDPAESLLTALDVLAEQAAAAAEEDGPGLEIPGVAAGFFSGDQSAFQGAYVDDDMLPEARYIDMLASRGIVEACGELMLEFCPNSGVTGAEALVWLQRAVPGLDTDIELDYRVDRQLIEDQLLAAMTSAATWRSSEVVAPDVSVPTIRSRLVRQALWWPARSISIRPQRVVLPRLRPCFLCSDRSSHRSRSAGRLFLPRGRDDRSGCPGDQGLAGTTAESHASSSRHGRLLENAIVPGFSLTFGRF